MDDAFLMRSLQGLCNLLRDPKGLINRDRSSRNPLLQRLAVDQLQHQELWSIRLLEAVDRRDLGVIERSENVRLALEPGDSLRIVRERRRQRLDGDLSPELQILWR